MVVTREALCSPDWRDPPSLPSPTRGEGERLGRRWPLVPLVRQFGLAARDEVGERLFDRRIELRLFVVRKQPPAALGGARGRVLHPLVAPLLERMIVRDRALPERGLVVAERMGRAKKMLARTDLAEGVERQRVVVDRQA